MCMDILFRAAGQIVGLVLVTASFIYMFNPRRSQELIKQLVIGMAGFIVSAAIFQQMLNLSVHADASWFAILFVLSAVAYAVREFRKRGTKQEAHKDRGTERIRLP